MAEEESRRNRNPAHASTDLNSPTHKWFESQKTNGPIDLPAGTSGWVANLLGVVEALRAFTRPGLTWALLAVLTFAYFRAPEDVQAGMITEMQFAAFTAIFWWLGSRYTSKK